MVEGTHLVVVDTCFDCIDGSLESEWIAVRKYFAVWHDCPIDAEPANLPPEFATASTAIQEWSKLAQSLQAAQLEDALRDFIEIKEVPEHDAIGILWQCEADFIWAIAKDSWGAENPEVLGFALDYDASEKTFDPVGAIATSLSEFALTHSSHFIYRSFASAAVQAPDDPAWMEKMKSTFSVVRQLGKTQIFENPGVIALVSSDAFKPSIFRLKVALKHPDSLNQCPEVCLSVLKDRGWFSGYFGEDTFRKSKQKEKKKGTRAKPFWQFW